MMKPVTTKAEMLTLSRKTEQWKIQIQYVHMNVKVPASLTEEVIKAQIKSFLTDRSESIPTPAS